ncbi:MULTISPECIES: hypothetical protein [Pseudomonas]|jgi:hypothetical protein|uniref:DUF3077 domain-containing protein n=2 Tax=Pseudomonas putida TaxID=303 RepID=A0A379KDJ2_PSEPU|nr:MULTISPECIES: hypothetical protein [Pseudomonas]KAF1311690.1 hypothetical protein BLX42_07395 [Pseudomonas sp. SG-MS2]KHL73089.1 hypothetical protein PpSQ1_17555 [Pseudomonas putida]MBM7399859.1 hypothetical protein [Pseudomonas sp. M5]MDH1574007.1 hypothetical protein [Pseudomonas sp. GD03746]QQE85457.1 hypothetical protein JET17_07180 [Pseudomonas putida]
MKKIVPDPPHNFDLPSDKTLSSAISERIVPIDHVVMNVTHYLMLAYNHCHMALYAIEDEATRELMVNGLRAMQIAWGQSDALSLALERTNGLH